MSDEANNTADQSATFNDTMDDGEVLTLSELLAEQREMTESADAVLGGSDEDFCTYSQGYVKRQALYACLTCVPESKADASKRAGVCLACSYNCHDGHDLLELYTKRAFRCDCGTSKILAIRCKLDSNKMDDNDANVYNQNFSGLYCTCNRPYPDPDDSIADEMIQCILCEDWLHSRHLSGKTPDSSQYDEMICDACTLKHDFLSYYSGYAIDTGRPTDANTTLDTTINVTDLDTSIASTTSTATATADVGQSSDIVEADQADGQNPPALDADINQCIQNIIEITRSNVEVGADEPAAAKKRAPDADPSSSSSPDASASKRAKMDDSRPSTSQADAESACRKPTITLQPLTGATYWSYDWRTKLCRCAGCMRMYAKGGVAFLVDDDDTVKAYQEKGKAKQRAAEAEASSASASTSASATATSAIQAAANGMDHVVKVEAIMAYNKLKEKLTEFFSGFVASEKVITAKDVDAFFENIKKSEQK